MVPLLVLILVAQACVAIITWHSPGTLAVLAAHLASRREALESYRLNYSAGVHEWLDRQGVDPFRKSRHSGEVLVPRDVR